MVVTVAFVFRTGHQLQLRVVSQHTADYGITYNQSQFQNY